MSCATNSPSRTPESGARPGWLLATACFERSFAPRTTTFTPEIGLLRCPFSTPPTPVFPYSPGEGTPGAQGWGCCRFLTRCVCLPQLPRNLGKSSLLTDGALANWEASLKQRGPPSGEFLLKSSRACPLGAPELLQLLTPGSSRPHSLSRSSANCSASVTGCSQAKFRQT
jgi:hypothetical protein